jgi:hypothetical protein
VLGRIYYQRKRAIGKKKFGDSVKLEDFAKIRYSFLYEPTLVFSSPKQFWSSKEDGGAYEKAFGVQNEMANTQKQSLFALVRSDERWEQMKKRFTRQLSVAS